MGTRRCCKERGSSAPLLHTGHSTSHQPFYHPWTALQSCCEVPPQREAKTSRVFSCGSAYFSLFNLGSLEIRSFLFRLCKDWWRAFHVESYRWMGTASLSGFVASEGAVDMAQWHTEMALWVSTGLSVAWMWQRQPVGDGGTAEPAHGHPGPLCENQSAEGGERGRKAAWNIPAFLLGSAGLSHQLLSSR